MKKRNYLMVGYGSVAQGLTPLLFKHLDITADQIQILTADLRGKEIADKYGIPFTVEPLTPDNYERLLSTHLQAGDMLINLSVDVSSYALVEWCLEHGVMYTDTCVEPWAGGYGLQNGDSPLTNAQLRDDILSLRGKFGTDAPTALIAHGANPGLVSHFMKRGLHEMAKTQGLDIQNKTFSEIAEQLEIKTIHIAEVDTQEDGILLKHGEFANTWSVDGLLSEGYQFAEMGCGTHEGLGVNATTMTHGACTNVRSWVPSKGEQVAYMITHHEALSISAFLDSGHYRPSTYYAYRPSPKTCLSITNWVRDQFKDPAIKTLMGPAIKSGYDELGVLFITPVGSYWYGSTLDHKEATSLIEHNSATTLQVTATIIGGLKWMLENSRKGLVEAENADSDFILDQALPYLGHVRGVSTDWTVSDLSIKGFLKNC